MMPEFEFIVGGVALVSFMRGHFDRCCYSGRSCSSVYILEFTFDRRCFGNRI